MAARNLAILHLAIYSSTEAEGVPAASDQIEKTASEAAHEVLLRLFPNHKPRFDALCKAAGGRGEPELRSRVLARSLLTNRANDGASTEIPYIPKNGLGQWRRTEPAFRPPETPQWGQTKPFILDSSAQFRPPPPPSLTSPEYAREIDEVRALGGNTSAVRSEEQTSIARFWSDFSYTCTPPGHWNNIARYLASSHQLPTRDAARLFALLNVALADTGIATWEAKYHYNFWRPITAIRRAQDDGNPATIGNPGWSSLLPSPPHPEYVSGHAAFSGAAARILSGTFGDEVVFETTSDALPGVTRRFNSLRACAEEIARSRVYAGIHFGISGRNGLELGKSVADEALHRFSDLKSDRACLSVANPIPRTMSLRAEGGFPSR